MMLESRWMVAVACAGVAALVGCTSGEKDAAEGGDAYVVVEQQDDVFLDDDGSLLIVQQEEKAATPAESLAFAGLCKKITIVGVEILPDGRIGAISVATGPLGLEQGETFYVKALVHDGATGKVSLELGAEDLACCQMKGEYYNGVTRLTCSGDCDNGATCAIQTEVDPEGITVVTCGCPADT